MKKYIILIILYLTTSLLLIAQGNIKKQAISNFDADKYMGKWYQIARYDHRFERDLTSVTSTYARKPNGIISVVKEGYINSIDGEYKKNIGKAKLSKIKGEGKLEISYFLWFYYDYHIFELCPDYTYSVVGSPNGKYLWIYSRTPFLEIDKMKGIISRLENWGYDPSKIIYVKQNDK